MTQLLVWKTSRILWRRCSSKPATADVAKAYILYRQKRSEIREAKQYLGVADDLKLSVNAIEVLKKRYLRRDESGLVAETPGEMFARVAAHVSQAESQVWRRCKNAVAPNF